MSTDAGATRPVGRRRRVAAVLVRMYPQAWRNRYSDEFVDLLTAAPLTSLAVCDVVRGALDAHRNLPDLVWVWSGTLTRIRSAVAATFAAWVLFCFAAAGIGRTTNDPRFDMAADQHPLIDALRWLASAALAGSLLVVVGAALPLAGAAVWQACRRRDRIALALLASPVAGLAVVVGYTTLLNLLPEQPGHSVAHVVITVSWVILAVTVVEVACVAPPPP